MAGESRTTTDHEVIRRWAEERGGHPATVKGTPSGGEEAGLLRITFPDYGGEPEEVEEVSWDAFFEKFDSQNLAFVYQDKTKEGGVSRFNKLVSRH